MSIVLGLVILSTDIKVQRSDRKIDWLKGSEILIDKNHISEEN